MSEDLWRGWELVATTIPRDESEFDHLEWVPIRKLVWASGEVVPVIGYIPPLTTKPPPYTKRSTKHEDE